ncbi:MAG: ABC transporter ATP-binding protein [Haliscomenobacter sp.]|nr:ABC transporter ATP-binding protein [Haliscomenobacter sp.]
MSEPAGSFPQSLSPIPLLQVRDLRISFPSGKGVTTVVYDLSFDLFSGETLGLVGESGSGKTMIALAISGWLSPAAIVGQGQIAFLSKSGKVLDLSRPSSADFRITRGAEIGFIFQEPGTSLNPVMPCGVQIREAIQLHQNLSRKQAETLAMEWISRVKMDDPERIYRSFPHQLSGGQKQRVVIAMAMCAAPRLLIADEPTTALDVTVQAEILRLIKALQSEFGTAVLFISHDLNVVAEVADRVCVLKEGKLIEENRVEELFKNPKHPYSKALMQCRPSLGQPPRRLPTLAFPENRERAQMQPKESAQSLEAPGYPLLVVQNLSAWYPQAQAGLGWWKPKNWTKALDGVSFEAFQGETLGIVGESGCGKSTLAKTLLGLIPPHAGNVFFEGRAILSAPPEDWPALRRQLQMIFQDPFSSLNPRITALNSILEPLRYHQIGESEQARQEWAKEIVTKVGLDYRTLNRYPHAFSGGQRQRISIARALTLKPRFLVCDESVSSLDASVQAQVLNLLKDVQEEFGLTYLFISHDLSVIRFMSNRILVMNEGKIIESGKSEEILSNPCDPYTKRLIKAIPGNF